LKDYPLTDIRLVTTLVSDEGFRHLSHHSLERLVLWDNDIFTGNGLQYLPRTLRHLELRELPKFTAQGLAHLVAFPKLESLIIGDCSEVGSDDLRRLRKKNPSLKELVYDDSVLLTRN
jgi:hypothetical protein